MNTSRDIGVEESSGNVFADVGVPQPEEALAKAKLMRLIKLTIEREGLTQIQAAERAGIAQSDISNIVRGRGRTYTMDRLFTIIHGLGGTVTIEAEIGRAKERITVRRAGCPRCSRHVRVSMKSTDRRGSRNLRT